MGIYLVREETIDWRRVPPRALDTLMVSETGGGGIQTSRILQCSAREECALTGGVPYIELYQG